MPRPDGTAMRLCADVGGSFVDLALVDEACAIVHRERHPTPTRDWDTFAAIFRDACERHAACLDPHAPVAIATAGLVDPDSGTITAANLPCLDRRPLAEALAPWIGRPVRVLNDADAFVLAEAGLGAARGHAHVFGIILGTGVGGGLVADGRVVTGRGGIGGEWGHGAAVTPSPRAPDANPVFDCGCGRRGCLDTIGSARGLERLHRFLHGTAASSHAITRAAEAGDPAALATQGYYCELVGGQLAMLLNTLPVTLVPVGGGLSHAHGLVAALDRQVRAQMLAPTAYPLLVPSRLGGDAGLLGAALFAAS